ncbi:helix-turn-helix domain-containing protein [Amantichitinum ursilacus]|uniref:Antitoxin igA-2 n=1 Tax=Amantichitinum ursilacus TaxID=857265 RepID=A0A0N1JTI4_9NEIS|nr:XRE family transcriptional regulator [Amantichitinum ursilacus]KPC54424.1 Antitoxin igA-2 [Amantichitinum ursilacus]
MTRKRNLFAELSEGFDALQQAREGKITLRQHKATIMPKAPEVTAAELVALRQRLNMSRAVMALHLRTNERTLEGWEQGKARPNAQAALLIKLVDKFPDMFERLRDL